MLLETINHVERKLYDTLSGTTFFTRDTIIKILQSDFAYSLEYIDNEGHRIINVTIFQRDTFYSIYQVYHRDEFGVYLLDQTSRTTMVRNSIWAIADKLARIKYITEIYNPISFASEHGVLHTYDHNHHALIFTIPYSNEIVVPLIDNVELKVTLVMSIVESLFRDYFDGLLSERCVDNVRSLSVVDLAKHPNQVSFLLYLAMEMHLDRVNEVRFVPGPFQFPPLTDDLSAMFERTVDIIRGAVIVPPKRNDPNGDVLPFS